MKKFFKYFGLLLLLAVLGISAFLVKTWYFKPFTINHFFLKTALQFATDSPETLSSLHVFEKFGITGHNAKLDDASIEASNKLFAKIHNVHTSLLSYADEDLDETEKLSKDILLSLLETIEQGKKFRFHNYPVNQLFGVQSNFPSFMESTHQIHDTDDAQDYITRLSLVDTKFMQVIEGLKYRQAHGILPPQFVVTKVLEEMNNFIATPIEKNILIVSMVEKMEAANIAKDKQADLAKKAIAEVQQTVYPAYQKLIDYFVKLDDVVENNYGVWNLPNGDEFYRLALKFFTTTDYSPDYIHNFGLQEVERLQAEILTILAQQGRDVAQGFEVSINNMAHDQRFYYSDSKEGREQILDDYQTILDEVAKKLSSQFYDIPQAKLKVKRIPLFKEKTSPGAYYNGAAMDGSRPGIFYANLYDIKATPKYSMRTLAYHEGIPGHHFQISTQQELENIPFFRKLIPFTAYVEGWALYAEHLAYEMGLEKDPYDNIGRLQAELFRAVRLVVDTGIHAKRWSREKAIDYMIRNTGMAQSDVIAEIERYFVIPGQATSYKMGMTKILELRGLAQEKLGDKFDIRDFHRVVLSNGSVPLDILEDLVKKYIASKSR